MPKHTRSQELSISQSRSYWCWEMKLHRCMFLHQLPQLRLVLLTGRLHSQASAPLLSTPQHVVSHLAPTLALVISQSCCLRGQWSLGKQVTIMVTHAMLYLLLLNASKALYLLFITKCIAFNQFWLFKQSSLDPSVAKVKPTLNEGAPQHSHFSFALGGPLGCKQAKSRKSCSLQACQCQEAKLTYGRVQHSHQTRLRSLDPHHTAIC